MGIHGDAGVTRLIHHPTSSLGSVANPATCPVPSRDPSSPCLRPAEAGFFS